tara:strand:+ start:238 stop:1416 length:1179 start_codon:yes stop_codon:yes gene_type:complete
MKNKYPLTSDTWGSEELAAIKDIMESNQYTMGKEVKKFEIDFAEYFKTKYAVMVNSGSSANLLAVASLFYKKDNFLKRGDEVIVPAISWSTTYYPLQQYGLKLKFVDIDKETLNIKLSSLEKAITSKTKLIFAVNVLGNSNEFEEINRMIEKKNIILLEDNCESLGAKYKERYTGTFGLMGTNSFFFSHHISTMEGGMITTDDEELYQILLSLRAHGWTRNLPKTNHITGTKSKFPFEESFKFVLPGYNLRPLEFSGKIGQSQLKKLDGFIDNRRSNADHFHSLASKKSYVIVQKEIGESSWFGFSLILNPIIKTTRRTLVQQLEKAGIQTRPIISGNFTNNRVIDYFDYTIFDNLDNANLVDQYGFFVGNHHYNIEDKIDYLFYLLDKTLM